MAHHRLFYALSIPAPIPLIMTSRVCLSLIHPISSSSANGITKDLPAPPHLSLSFPTLPQLTPLPCPLLPSITLPSHPAHTSQSLPLPLLPTTSALLPLTPSQSHLMAQLTCIPSSFRPLSPS
ncbi:hypothetical protein AMTR_s00020p00208240 [Amborella trichopoda]|uniref:Uncharacterized protein n=1 Tax=Amborella trichopoda TaxID=13333 RepID=W1PVP6_AMBTC|nr:hypothetical protein AMTR_s00020p00208240 [Amborella trichopoda]